MKPFLFILLVVCSLLLASPVNSYALFGHVAAERQRRMEAEQKLVAQQQQTARWQTASFILGITSVVMLVTGAAIGSRGSHDANSRK